MRIEAAGDNYHFTGECAGGRINYRLDLVHRLAIHHRLRRTGVVAGGNRFRDLAVLPRGDYEAELILL
jgi:hypothetical protein